MYRLIIILIVHCVNAQVMDNYLATYELIVGDKNNNSLNYQLSFNQNMGLFTSENKMFDDYKKELDFKIFKAIHYGQYDFHSSISGNYAYSPIIWINQKSKVKLSENAINWNINYEKVKIIDGIKCFYAEAKMSKEDCSKVFFEDVLYKVWFSEDYPCNWGPFGANGLPGLIYEFNFNDRFVIGLKSIKKIKSVKNDFSFTDELTCEEYQNKIIDKINESIEYKEKNNKVIEMGKEKLKKQNP